MRLARIEGGVVVEIDRLVSREAFDEVVSNAENASQEIENEVKEVLMAASDSKDYITELIESEAPAKRVKYLFIHVSDGNPNWTAKELDTFFQTPVAKGGRGWKEGSRGYGYVITALGTLQKTQPESQISFGALGYNSNSLHVCCPGKLPNAKQAATLKRFVLEIVKKYPDIQVGGHYQVGNKTCPNFNVPLTFAGIIPDRNIFAGDKYGYGTTLKPLQL